MPPQKPGKSKQNYSTPSDFIEAVEKRFGAITFDLAASLGNKKSQSVEISKDEIIHNFFSEEDDSLSKPWHKLEGNLWLNPPYAHIEPWARKSALEMSNGAVVLFLVPASVGSDWYRKWVEPYAYVLALTPRLSFDGKNSYPKDCILGVYNSGLTGFKTWRWKD